MLDGPGCGARIEGRALDADALLADPGARGIRAVIPARKNRTVIREHDRDLDGWRHPIENFFAERKAFRGIATRAGKTVVNFSAFIDRVAGVIAGRWVSTGPRQGSPARRAASRGGMGSRAPCRTSFLRALQSLLSLRRARQRCRFLTRRTWPRT